MGGFRVWGSTQAMIAIPSGEALLSAQDPLGLQFAVLGLALTDEFLRWVIPWLFGFRI